MESLFQTKPHYPFLNVFGCLCFPYLRPYNNHKLSLRSSPCLFLGYSNLHKGYKCLDSSGRLLFPDMFSLMNLHFPMPQLHN